MSVDVKMASTKSKEIADEYISSLSDLTNNSKPLINMLTMLAEDNIEHASAIVQAVETHLQKVRSDIKLPVLYLIDSIVKKVNRDYLNLFMQNIVNTFCGVFEKVDESTRARMWKLRQTWNDVFPPKKLFSLDVRVRRIDPAWPTTAPSSGISSESIHVNPRFHSMPQQAATSIVQPVAPPVKLPPGDPVTTTKVVMREQLLKKQRELLELQKKKIGLELLQVKASLEQQQRQLDKQGGSLKTEMVAPTFQALLTKKQTVQGKPATPVMPNQVTKQVTEQFPAAAASFLKNARTNSGPRITLASSIAVASAKPVSRDPRLKSIPVQSVAVPTVDPRQRVGTTSPKESRADGQTQPTPNINTVFSNQLKQQLLSKPAITSTTNKPSINLAGSDAPAINTNNNNDANTNMNNNSNNKNCSGNTNKDAFSYRTSQKKDPRLSSNSSAILNGNSFKNTQSLSVDSNSSSSTTLSASNRGSGGGDSKSKDTRSSSSSADKSSTSSKFSHRKVGKSRSKQAQAGPSKISKLDRDSSPIRSKFREKDSIDNSPSSSRISPQSSFQASKNRKKNTKSGSLIVSPPHPSAFKEIRPNTKQKNYVRQNKDDSLSPDHSPASAGNAQVTTELTLESSSKDENLRAPLSLPGTVSVQKEGLDLRISLSVNTNKRTSTEHVETTAVKRLKTEKFDALFGNEDVHLRTLTHPKAGRPPTREDSKVAIHQRKSSATNEKEVIRNKQHPMSRNPNGPRWQNQPWQQPWAHPPGPPYGRPQGHFNSGMRHVAPWQNPRHFGPMRPDYQYHGGFNRNMGPNPRLGPGTMGPMGPNGPIMSNILPNGPVGPMGMPNPPMSIGCHPAMMMNNGPMTNLMANSNMPPLSSGRNLSLNTVSKYDLDDNDQNYGNTIMRNQDPHNRELPAPNPKLLAEIARDTVKSINIDNIPREIRYYGQTGVVFMNWDDPREIGFHDGIRRILINGKDTITCAFNDQYKEFMYEREIHRIKLGAPTRELYIDDRWYECYFGGMPITIELGSKKVSVKLEGPPPQVKIGTVKRTDLVVAKINLIINARNMMPVFLDAKTQIFEIEGKPHTLEFIDALQTVLLNGRSFKFEFGGLPKPIIVRDKKHFIRFSILPRGVRAGYVKITGMRGESPIGSPSTTTLPAIKPKVDVALTPSQLPVIEHESTSQDSSDRTSPPKPDLQLDMLSSVLPSAMAPSSGLSYQAEPAEDPSASAAPLSISELFQRLVETGIIPNLTEQKKPEEEEKKEPEVICISFDKPESLKTKQPAIVTALYSGLQCSSCGARFAPELATLYNQHLDWHFRQNRRERDSARKAHSRPWYYNIGDWMQSEEVEDLEDRPQSWFETEKQTAETEGVANDDLPQETLQPSVATGSDEDSRCQVCHDAFEQFYNEKKEEWHLRPAINYEEKNYHPLCLEDYKRVLERSTSTLEETIPEVGESKRECSEETFGEESKQKEFDVEMSNKELESTENTDRVEESFLETAKLKSKEEPCKTGSPEVTQNNTEEKEKLEEETANEKSIDTESTERFSEESTMNEEEKSEAETMSAPFENIKIREEPMDEIDEQTESELFEFANVVVKEEPMDPDTDPDGTIVNGPAIVDTTYVAMKSSIDGNVELESTPSRIPAAPPRIKINITKPLSANKKSEENKEKEKVAAVETPVEETMKPLVAASIKPSLRGRKLSTLPPVQKGHELSGLCSIM